MVSSGAVDFKCVFCNSNHNAVRWKVTVRCSVCGEEKIYSPSCQGQCQQVQLGNRKPQWGTCQSAGTCATCNGLGVIDG